MGRHSCELNKQLAKEAVDSVKSGESTAFQLDDVMMSRMLVCGPCPETDIDAADVKECFRKSVDILADKITEYDEWGRDPELSQIRKREQKARYREKHHKDILSKSRGKRDDKRLEQLRKEMGGNHE